MEIKFTDANFKQEALEADTLVMVDFFADWCGPCKMMAPIVEKLAEEYAGKVKIGKLNVDENQETAGAYRVMSIPTILFIKGGKVVETVVGAVSKEDLEGKIRANQ